MVNLKEYNLSAEDERFLEEIYINVYECASEVTLRCGNYEFVLELGNYKLYVTDTNLQEWQFDSFDDFLKNFLINGKPFLDIISDVDLINW